MQGPCAALLSLTCYFCLLTATAAANHHPVSLADIVIVLPVTPNCFEVSHSPLSTETVRARVYG